MPPTGVLTATQTISVFFPLYTFGQKKTGTNSPGEEGAILDLG